MIDVLMPALSPTMEEGALAKWHVRIGDKISPGQVIAEIETDKATMEVEAVDEGFVQALLVAEGAQGVPVNTPIARVAPEASAETPSAPAPKTAQSIEARPVEPAPPPIAKAVGSVARPPAIGPAKATPLAISLARAAGVALDKPGSGPDGRITLHDLRAVLGRASTPVAPALPALKPQPAPAKPVAIDGAYDLQPLDGMRRTIARRMTDSFRDVPHFPLSVDIEIDALMAIRERLNARLAPVKASLNDILIKAAAATLRRVPEANASFTPEGIARHHDVDIAFAVAIDGGLITPIVRKADQKGVGQIAMETRDLAERARARQLAPAEFQGGTFSISNLGMYGIKSFTSIINEPQGAILSVGTGEPRPVVRDGQIAIATVMTVTLTCDHRAMDGAVAAAWVRTFKSVIEEPMGLLL